MNQAIYRGKLQDRIPASLSAIAIAALLSACGGGGGGGPSGDAPPPIQTQTLTLSGTAATGAAIASAPVEARCASGTGNATSRADGGFDVTVSGGRLPCVLRVTAPGGTVLHTVAIGTGSSVRANISPLTDLALASALGVAPSTLWDSFTPARVTSEALAAGVAVVQAVVASTGYAVSIGSPFTAVIVPGDDNNPADEALDRLAAVLDSGGLERLRQILINTSPGNPAPTPTASTNVSLPPELQVAPKAATCASLASGRYRILGFGNGDFADTATLNATTLTLRQLFDDGSPPETTQLSAGTQPCEFTFDGGTTRIVVGAAGVALISFVSDDGASRRMALMFPEQSYTLADLRGEWLLMQTKANGSVLRGSRGSLTLSANGTLTAGTYCENFGTCVNDDATTLAQITLSARTDGGFNSTDTAAPNGTARVFGFRSGGGQLHLIGIGDDGGWQFLTRKRTLGLPAVGDVSEGWNLSISGSGQVAGNLTNFRSTAVSVNAGSTPPTFTRDNVFNFTTLATVPETLERNGPADGYQRRLPATGVTASDGSVRNVSEFIGMPLGGTGLTPLWIPGNSSFSLSLNKPLSP